MAMHEPKAVTLADIIDGIERSTWQWCDNDGIVFKAEYTCKHDTYCVSWPEHVITPRFNSDASYQRVKGSL